jgi:cutinase
MFCLPLLVDRLKLETWCVSERILTITENANTYKGTIVGPPTSDALKAEFGAQNVATEGIDYAAALAPNSLPGGTDRESSDLMLKTLTDMMEQCPDSTIVAGGYSQGSAVNHRAIEQLSAAQMDRIAGVVLYGDTQKQQDNDQIPGFPQDKTKIICANGDLVCVGTLVITPAHLTYGRDAQEGADFLASQVKSAQAKKAKRDAIVKRMAQQLTDAAAKVSQEIEA